MNKYTQEIKNITSINDLRIYHFKKIIHLTYIVMLGRDVDNEGVSYYLQKLNNGYTYKQMQDNIRDSDEYKIYQKNKITYPSKIIMYLTPKNVALEKLTPQGKNIYFQLKSCIKKG